MMSDFFKRNLVWIAILLCIGGVVLSIIGIPTGKPIFFFVGIVLSIPTIGYLIYQVFFYRDKPELNLTPTTAKYTSSNITSIITQKDDVLLKNEITDDDDLEPLYNGYANDQEIAKRLQELTNNERQRAIIELPEIQLPKAEPGNFDEDIAIQELTNDELLQQREVLNNSDTTFSTEVPPAFIEETTVATEEANEPLTDTVQTAENTKPVSYTVNIDNFDTLDENNESLVFSPERQEITNEQSVELTLDAPDFIPPTEPVLAQNPDSAQPVKLTPVDLTNKKIVSINTATIEKRKQKAQEKKTLLEQSNLERYLRRYFIETAVCFLLDRTFYKDKYGIAPYNKLAINKDTNLPEYTMSATKGKLYKFCTYLIDTERFITHQYLYDDFITAVEQGISLSRISETLHSLYRKKYKKDFILNLSNREDWDNVIILVYNNYILNNDNFKDIFTHVPFEIPFAYNDENIIDYLKDPDLQERFAEKYSALEEIGVPTFWEAVYICFINSIKQKLTTEQLETAIMREYKKIARSLKRLDNTRRKTLRKAS